jgi:hypothetical protein
VKAFVEVKKKNQEVFLASPGKMGWLRELNRVARFFLTQYTKMGVKYTKLL